MTNTTGKPKNLHPNQFQVPLLYSLVMNYFCVNDCLDKHITVILKDKCARLSIHIHALHSQSNIYVFTDEQIQVLTLKDFLFKRTLSIYTLLCFLSLSYSDIGSCSLQLLFYNLRGSENKFKKTDELKLYFCNANDLLVPIYKQVRNFRRIVFLHSAQSITAEYIIHKVRSLA